MLVIEFFRSQDPKGPHGDVHIRVREPKTVREPWTACGLTTTVNMRKLGTPFRNWEEVMCAECTRYMEGMDDD